VTEHIRGVLELKPDVQARHDSDRTLRQHKSLVRARLGITADPGRAREVAGQAIRAAAQAKDNPGRPDQRGAGGAGAGPAGAARLQHPG